MRFDSELPPRKNDQAISVSQLNGLARRALESTIPLQWVAGEISNLTRAASGHIYFTLKDEQAQVRCTMWRSKAQLLPFQLAHGQKVEVRALTTLYEARGDFQLSVETVRKAGVGSLFEAFLQLRDRLDREGLFDAANKRPIPEFPRGIGVVTSLQAAALRDVLASIHRRAPHLAVTVYPAPVQGADAPRALREAVERAGERAAREGIEILLLVRGGGSLEDLWAFNDEELARAVRSCPVPVIAGIGHETDFTIADFVADLRAATPTAAAELATAGFEAVGRRLAVLAPQLQRNIQRRLENAAQHLDRAAMRLIHPRERLARGREHLENLGARLDRAAGAALLRHAHALSNLGVRLESRRPDLRSLRGQLAQLDGRLQRAALQATRRQRERLESLGSSLAHLNPESVLGRGYSITRDAEGRILHDASTVRTGMPIEIRLSRGRLEAVVSASHPGKPTAEA